MFDELHCKTGAILTAFGHTPRPGSVAANELSSLEDPEPLKSAYSQGTILIEATADQLSGFVRTVTPPVLTVSPWTNIRSVLEAAAISSWLLDDSLGISERIARSYAFRCKGLLEQVKFARVVDNPADLDKAQQRLDYVLSQAATLGLATINGRSGKTTGLSKPIPSTTELVRDQLNDEEAYRLLSAMTHAHPWALQQLGFKKADNSQHLLLEKNLKIESVVYLATIGLKALRKPIEYKCRLFGWPVVDITSMFDEVMTNLALVSRSVISSE